MHYDTSWSYIDMHYDTSWSYIDVHYDTSWSYIDVHYDTSWSHNDVPFQNLIRSELKESLKWNIDRSSPSEKIRDFMLWAKLIMSSINYQQKVQSNLITKFLSDYM